jgi:Ca-activated chloride channel family protein
MDLLCCCFFPKEETVDESSNVALPDIEEQPEHQDREEQPSSTSTKISPPVASLEAKDIDDSSNVALPDLEQQQEHQDTGKQPSCTSTKISPPVASLEAKDVDDASNVALPDIEEQPEHQDREEQPSNTSTKLSPPVASLEAKDECTPAAATQEPEGEIGLLRWSNLGHTAAVGSVATLATQHEARAGSTVSVQWTGPNDKRDFVGVCRNESGTYRNFAPTISGNPAQLVMPTQAGTYEIKYFAGKDNSVLAAAPIIVVIAEATLVAPNEARTGSTVSVQWTGPNDNGDFVGICSVGSRKYDNYSYTCDGSPAQLVMPTRAGMYEIKYFVGQDNSVIAVTPITVVTAEATLVVPNEARVGSTVSVQWTGPNDNGDFIGVCPVGSATYNSSYAYTCSTGSGNPAQLVMPTRAGAYEIHYFVGQDNSVLATALINVVTAEVTLVAPNEARAGSTVSVQWTGPNDNGDFVGVCLVGSATYGNYASACNGNRAQLVMPTRAGMYEIKYFVGQDNSVIAVAPITVVTAEATLVVPNEARAGSTVSVQWTGPNDYGDFVGVSPVGPRTYRNYAPTCNGNPIQLVMPTRAGTYEIKYFVGQDNSVLAAAPITVVAAEATLVAPNEATSGSTVSVQWTGPNDDGDFVGVCPVGSATYGNYAVTCNGNPAQLVMPTGAGAYEIKYFVGQENSVLAAAPITVVTAEETRVAPKLD